METIKSPRFWLALAVVGASTVLAATKVISGDLAVGLLSGVLSGLVMASSKVDAGKNGLLGAFAAAGIGGALLLGGCEYEPGFAVVSLLVSLMAAALTLAVVAVARWSVADASRRKRIAERAARIRRSRGIDAGLGLLAALTLSWLIVAAAGCAGWQERANTALSAAAAATKGITDTAGPAFRAACSAAVDYCATTDCAKTARSRAEAEAQCRPVPECVPMFSCWAARDTVAALLDAADRAIAAGYTAIAIGNETEARVALAQVGALLVQIYDAIDALAILKTPPPAPGPPVPRAPDAGMQI